MMNKLFIKIFILFFIVWHIIGNVFANSTPSDMFWGEKVLPSLRWWWNDLVSILDNILWYLIGLLYFISVVVVIYGWFRVLTSWGDDEQLKKWKNLIIYALIGLIIIFLASNIIYWIIDVMGQVGDD